ncbi:MAG TPA: ATP-binding cassette domain-containing protein [Rhizomicrobium sp.]|nr:ATP-binding cassette domain-containing protein [Rhizomicrobium sp.]
MTGEGNNTSLLRNVRRDTHSAAAETRDSVIQLRGLVNGFGDKVIHDHIDLDVCRGEVLGVVGGSGSGKSVLMRAIIGLIRPKEGSVTVFGKPTSGDIEGGAMRQLEMRWGVLFQEGALFSSQTVAENIQVPLREYTGMSQTLMDEIAEMKLAMVGLPPDTADKYPSELSGGMKKRAGLARALALDPELLFLDEPTAGLDPISANQFDELINQLQKSLGLTVFLVTHDIDTLRAVTDRIAVLVNKKLVLGTIEDLRHNQDPWIKDYFSGVRGRAALSSIDSASQEAH